LGAPLKDVSKYERIAEAYGNVAPAIVAAEGGMYRLIDGYARVEAYARAGVNEIPVVVARAGSSLEQIRLSLLLSASREQGSPISEGAMIEKLIREHGQTLAGLSNFVGKSKSWLSKRQTMARDMSAALCEMVLSGAVCARSAEEIAKLPRGEQAMFAANAARDGLSKDDVCELVRMYRSPDATPELCRAVIESPSDALPSSPRGRRGRRGRRKGTPEGRIGGAAFYAMNLLDEIAKMLIECDGAALAPVCAHLLNLRGKMRTLIKLIGSRVDESVSPGQQPGAAGGGEID